MEKDVLSTEGDTVAEAGFAVLEAERKGTLKKEIAQLQEQAGMRGWDVLHDFVSVTPEEYAAFLLQLKETPAPDLRGTYVRASNRFAIEEDELLVDCREPVATTVTFLTGGEAVVAKIVEESQRKNPSGQETFDKACAKLDKDVSDLRKAAQQLVRRIVETDKKIQALVTGFNDHLKLGEIIALLKSLSANLRDLALFVEPQQEVPREGAGGEAG